jgi:hypothetical protein
MASYLVSLGISQQQQQVERLKSQSCRRSMSLEREIGLACELPECGRRDFLPTRCDLCELVVCGEHVDFHGCRGKRAERKHHGSAQPDHKLFKCSVCNERELVRWTCKLCHTQLCLAHRAPKSHACKTTTTTSKPKVKSAAAAAAAVAVAAPAPAAQRKAEPEPPTQIVVSLRFSSGEHGTTTITVPSTATSADLFDAVRQTLPQEAPFQLRFVRKVLSNSSNETLSELGFGTRASVVVHAAGGLEEGQETERDESRPADAGCFALLFRSVFS